MDKNLLDITKNKIQKYLIFKQFRDNLKIQVFKLLSKKIFLSFFVI